MLLPNGKLMSCQCVVLYGSNNNHVLFCFVYVCVEQPDGTVKAKKHNPAISQQTITEVHELMKSCLDIADIVDKLRIQAVPAGYSCYPWQSGMWLGDCDAYLNNI